VEKLALTASTHLPILLRDASCAIIGLHVEENRFGWPLRGIIWLTVAIIGCSAVIALLAGYEQTAKSLEKISHRAPQ
jgi:hypothetical protein